ncbi:ArnT family glycosyltransferase [Pedobacter rhizosphaerae]|uniref:4-amino-4-deoxy-L-arabinose transferase n=1 Tax=Pedobacter rhizosphaerae TaxID=390241 RepID=A0A1H9RQW6_9SPHI|nr:glycosyltransferase family 39 protein [Pedobacter rhizosphaerae]SER75096.1 4-amino-4-deoxy-L-arabinose transferase [Pedobacter rhizosphaerae]
MQEPTGNNNPLYKDQLILSFFLLLKIVLSFLLINNIYELHRDEFLHLDQANHLAAGYTSVPPLTAIFSWLIKILGNGYFWIKLFPALFGAWTIYFCWKTIELLKGNLLARCLVSIACLCSAFLRLNTLYQPNSFDVLAWTAVFYFLLVYFEQKDYRAIYLVIIWVALGFLNKYNILFLLVGLLPSLLITTRRNVFTDKHFYFAAALGLILIAPNLIWQVNHHFPVISHMKELQRSQLVNVSRVDFLWHQVLFFANAIFILFAGLLSLIFYKPFKAYRWVILTYIFTLTVFCYFRAKDYYALGLYPIILVFGASYLGEKLAQRKILTGLLVLFTVGSFIYILPLIMPVYSPKQIVAHQQRFKRVGALRWEDGKNHQLPQDYADMQGWKELAHLADMAYAQVKDRSEVLVRADNYGEAGAVNYYSRFKSINTVSYNADYLYWFKLDKEIKHLILIREPNEEDPERKKERPFFEKITKIGEVTNPYAREKGASVFLLENAKIDINSRIEQEIQEEQNDH